MTRPTYVTNSKCKQGYMVLHVSGFDCKYLGLGAVLDLIFFCGRGVKSRSGRQVPRWGREAKPDKGPGEQQCPQKLKHFNA